MNYITAAHTDVGIRKKTNQDSVVIEQAETDYGTVLLAAVCDGMGGHAKGELASATLAKNLSDWFYKELPTLLYDGLQPEVLRESWEKLLDRTNRQISTYSEQRGLIMGTTCVVLLTVEGIYYIMNVGDSRAYLLTDRLYQLTKDQTYCQKAIDEGRMTPEQAAVDPQRSVLLQCVGASENILPDFFAGRIEPGQSIMMCSDGFRHLISPQEIYGKLNGTVAADSYTMQQNLIYLVELNKSRNETDNISAVLFKAI